MQELIEALTALTSRITTAIDKSREMPDEGESTWDALWYVYSDEKGEVEYKSEDAAREGGRYWVANSDHPALVDVYCRERHTQLHRRAPLDRALWLEDGQVSA